MPSTSWIKGVLEKWCVAHESPHHRAEEALREIEQTLRMFVDHGSDAFFLLDDD
jgi:PAS domain-containing protein